MNQEQRKLDRRTKANPNQFKRISLLSDSNAADQRKSYCEPEESNATTEEDQTTEERLIATSNTTGTNNSMKANGSRQQKSVNMTTPSPGMDKKDDGPLVSPLSQPNNEELVQLNKLVCESDVLIDPSDIPLHYLTFQNPKPDANLPRTSVHLKDFLQKPFSLDTSVGITAFKISNRGFYDNHHLHRKLHGAITGSELFQKVVPKCLKKNLSLDVVSDAIDYVKTEDYVMMTQHCFDNYFADLEIDVYGLIEFIEWAQDHSPSGELTIGYLLQCRKKEQEKIESGDYDGAPKLVGEKFLQKADDQVCKSIANILSCCHKTSSSIWGNESQATNEKRREYIGNSITELFGFPCECNYEAVSARVHTIDNIQKTMEMTDIHTDGSNDHCQHYNRTTGFYYVAKSKENPKVMKRVVFNMYFSKSIGDYCEFAHSQKLQKVFQRLDAEVEKRGFYNSLSLSHEGASTDGQFDIGNPTWKDVKVKCEHDKTITLLETVAATSRFGNLSSIVDTCRKIEKCRWYCAKNHRPQLAFIVLLKTCGTAVLHFILEKWLDTDTQMNFDEDTNIVKMFYEHSELDFDFTGPLGGYGQRCLPSAGHWPGKWYWKDPEIFNKYMKIISECIEYSQEIPGEGKTWKEILEYLGTIEDIGHMAKITFFPFISLMGWLGTNTPSLQHALVMDEIGEKAKEALRKVGFVDEKEQ